MRIIDTSSLLTVVLDFRVGCGASRVIRQELPECVQDHGIAELSFGILKDKTLR